jgi:hypothetical protein
MSCKKQKQSECIRGRFVKQKLPMQPTCINALRLIPIKLALAEAPIGSMGAVA